MNEILNKKYSRKSFLFMVALIATVLILCRYIIFPCIDQSIKTGWLFFFTNITDGLLVSLLVSVFIGLFIFWITPDVLKEAKIEIKEPRELPELFESSFPSTDLWWYKGGCGRYFRTKTLPQMANWARKNSLSREIIAVILDPSDNEACESHSNYRRSTASSELEKNKWDVDQVRIELCTTIITSLVYQYEEPMLRINLYLCSYYSAFRIDLSKEYAIITKEDRKAPAIVCSQNTHFYKSYKEEILLTTKQSKQIPQIKTIDFNLDSIDKDHVSKILKEIGIELSNPSVDFYQKVADMCKERVNPYE
ncbi:TPA: hypothetical protein ACW7Y0_002743 [Aeromonas hydrophila]